MTAAVLYYMADRRAAKYTTDFTETGPLDLCNGDKKDGQCCCSYRKCSCLRLPDSYDAKVAKICNLWTFWPVIQSILKSNKKHFCPTLHRCKKRSDI